MVRGATPANEADYVALFRAVQHHGVNEKFGKRRYRYWRPGDGFKYWTMTTDVRTSRIINRAKIDEEKGMTDFWNDPVASRDAMLPPLTFEQARKAARKAKATRFVWRGVTFDLSAPKSGPAGKAPDDEVEAWIRKQQESHAH